MFRAFDAAFPPATPPPDCQAVLGYLGGNTPHAWELGEWRRFGKLLQAGIWVADLSASAVGQGKTAGAAAAALGWTPRRQATSRRIIFLDMETWQNKSFVTDFAHEVFISGYETSVYGSASTVGGNPPLRGYWLADWNNAENVAGKDVIGHQYDADQAWENGVVDYSVFEQEMIHHFGVGARHVNNN